MYMFVECPQIKCSACGSTSYESVRWGNLKFIRCLRCGHEGEKTEVIPRESTGSPLKYARVMDEMKVQEF